MQSLEQNWKTMKHLSGVTAFPMLVTLWDRIFSSGALDSVQHWVGSEAQFTVADGHLLGFEWTSDGGRAMSGFGEGRGGCPLLIWVISGRIYYLGRNNAPSWRSTSLRGLSRGRKAHGSALQVVVGQKKGDGDIVWGLADSLLCRKRANGSNASPANGNSVPVFGLKGVEFLLRNEYNQVILNKRSPIVGAFTSLSLDDCLRYNKTGYLSKFRTSMRQPTSHGDPKSPHPYGAKNLHNWGFCSRKGASDKTLQRKVADLVTVCYPARPSQLHFYIYRSLFLMLPLL